MKLRVRHYFLFFKFNRHHFWLHWHGSWYQLRHIVDARNRRVIDEGWSKAMCAWKGNGIKNVSKMGGVISIFLLLFIYMSFFFYHEALSRGTSRRDGIVCMICLKKVISITVIAQLEKMTSFVCHWKMLKDTGTTWKEDGKELPKEAWMVWNTPKSLGMTL